MEKETLKAERDEKLRQIIRREPEREKIETNNER